MVRFHPLAWTVGAASPDTLSHLLCAGTLSRFQADTGLAASPDELLTAFAKEWHAWRCAQITDWVAQAASSVHRIGPGTTLGLFTVPWPSGDLTALAAHVDVLSPMVYHRMCGRSIEWIAEVTAEVAATIGCPVWPIVQAVDGPEALPEGEFDAAIRAGTSDLSHGVILFHLKGVLQGGRLPVVRRHFGAAEQDPALAVRQETGKDLPSGRTSPGVAASSTPLIFLQHFA